MWSYEIIIPGAGSDLYNGNIAKMATAISGIPMLGKAYQYDELNRLVKSNTFEGNDLAATSKYNTSYQYDANGNMMHLNRDGNIGAMDKLSYTYAKDANGKMVNNRLLHVNDAVAAGAYGEDIDDQDLSGLTFAQNNPLSQNYRYDKIGNLVADKQEEIAEIKWNVQGKVAAIIRTTSSTKANLYFKYDAMGNRVSKTVVYPTTIDGVKELTTYYVRDAQGNVMAVYEKKKKENGTATIALLEQHLYGSSRLGIRDVKTAKKEYELTNHLGNVLAVVSDTKKSNGDANLVSYSDYFPFGSQMMGRVSGAGDYRYGFNGKEKDDEVKGDGNSLNFGARIYDSRLGKWLSLDPLATRYPALTPYNFALNSPLLFNDPDGKDARVTVQADKEGNRTIIISSIVYITGKAASAEKAEKLTEAASSFFNSSTVTVNGKNATINLDVKFVYADSKTSALEKMEAGDNLLEYNDNPVRSYVKATRSETTNTRTGKIVRIKETTGNEGEIGQEGSNRNSTAFHETLHFLGLSDRYKDNAEGLSEADLGFTNDIMGNSHRIDTKITDIHYRDWGKAFSNKTGTNILKDKVDINESSGELSEPTLDEKLKFVPYSPSR